MKLIRFAKKKFYKDFEIYFNKQQLHLFKEKILLLKNINKKFHTNISLEYFNRTFKRLYEMKANMNLVTYEDNLVEIIMDIKKFYIAKIKKISIVSKKNKINKKTQDIKFLLNISSDSDIMRQVC